MGYRVVVKLSSGKEVCPFLRVVGTEDAEVSFCRSTLSTGQSPSLYSIPVEVHCGI